MWMSLVEMNVWMRGRSASRTASAARSMSAAWARARPAITGPWTSRAIVRTASKSPGEAAGKPASITSTPEPRELVRDLELLAGVQRDARRLLAVAQCRVEDDDSVVHGAPVWALLLVLLQLGSRLRGRHALFPPRGEEKKEGEAEVRHVRRREYQRDTWMPSAFGAAQTARVSGSGRRPSPSMRSLRRKAARTTMPPAQASGSGGTGGGSPAGELDLGASRPLARAARMRPARCEGPTPLPVKPNA